MKVVMLADLGSAVAFIPEDLVLRLKPSNPENVWDQTLVCLSLKSFKKTHLNPEVFYILIWRLLDGLSRRRACTLLQKGSGIYGATIFLTRYDGGLNVTQKREVCI